MEQFSVSAEPSRNPDNTIAQLSLLELRRKWAEVWGLKPHKGIGRTMLEKSLAFKLRELRGVGLTEEQRKHLDHLVTMYRRNPRCFDQKQNGIKPGTRLVRIWKNRKHQVIVRPDGFEYEGRKYTSLSQVAQDITGTRWNGWLFFGLKEKSKA